MNFKYNYSKTMMMKILLSEPDGKGDSKIWRNFEQALDIIKEVDCMTQGVPKIVYLVGWQYLGHDDKYPAFFEINEKLKRVEDKTSRESLLWLIAEAKNYNTIVSFHINLSDAYVGSPLWQEYIDNNLILKKRNGKLKVTGVWFNRNAYQVRFKEEYESGFFKKRVDKLFNLLPMSEVGTVHVDAFFVRKGKDTSIATEKIVRLKMIEYFTNKGVDVTSEFIYREHKHGFRAHFGKSDTIGVIPAFWNPVLSKKDLITHQASELAGGLLCKSLTLDKNIEWLFYGNIQGEELFKKGENWQVEFLRQFATYNLAYLFLNCHKRVKITGIANSRQCYYTDNIKVSIKNKKIIENGIKVKENQNLCLPIFWKENSYIAYSENSGTKLWKVSGEKASIYQFDHVSKKLLAEVTVENGFINFVTSSNCAYLIEVIK